MKYRLTVGQTQSPEFAKNYDRIFGKKRKVKAEKPVKRDPKPGGVLIRVSEPE